jgi:fibronectin type 3 domain-containing protein
MLSSMRRLFQILAIVVTLVLLNACGIKDSSRNTSTSSQTTNDTTGAANSIDLAWIAPSTRADGSYLNARDLAGFRIYMGTSSNTLSPIVDIVNDNNYQYQVQNLTAGSYYFAITAYDQSGVESSLSQVMLIKLT